MYLRGLAYCVPAREPKRLRVQKILDHKGAKWGAYYSLSYVGLAHAAALAGDSARAGKAYQDFCALCKDADPTSDSEEAKRE